MFAVFRDNRDCLFRWKQGTLRNHCGVLGSLVEIVMFSAPKAINRPSSSLAFEASLIQRHQLHACFRNFIDLSLHTTTFIAFPARNAKTFSIANASPASVASGVMPAACGVSTTLGRVKNGESGGSGSFSNTSRPAPAIRP